MRILWNLSLLKIAPSLQSLLEPGRASGILSSTLCLSGQAL